MLHASSNQPAICPTLSAAGAASKAAVMAGVSAPSAAASLAAVSLGESPAAPRVRWRARRRSLSEHPQARVQLRCQLPAWGRVQSAQRDI
jgi:hypothetical protein